MADQDSRDSASPCQMEPRIEPRPVLDRSRAPTLWGLDLCKACGLCLQKCPAIEVGIEEAVAEVERLRAGTQTSRVLDACLSCYACNTVCPHGAHPYERILLAWHERYLREGLPRRARYFLPGQRPSFRQDLPFDPDERRLHAAWSANTPPAPTVLFPGCNLLAVPRLAESAIFEHLPVWGSWAQCCGEPFFRMGLLDQVAERAAALSAHYAAHRLETMVFLCPACYNMFTHLLPERFGAKFPFQTQHFADWFLAKVAEGVFHPGSLAGRRVVVQDSCHSRVLGAPFLEQQRALLALLDVEVVEPDLGWSCCGIAAGCRTYSVLDIVRESFRTLKSLEQFETGEIVTSCTGCWLMLSLVTALLRPFGARVTHILELVREALGEPLALARGTKPFSMLAGTVRHGLVHYLSRERFHL